MTIFPTISPFVIEVNPLTSYTKTPPVLMLSFYEVFLYMKFLSPFDINGKGFLLL
jgi:hypothetical protein